MKEKDFRDMLEEYLIVARQQVAPSHILLGMQRDIKEMKETLSEVVTQTTKTNGRVTALESWRASFGAFISGGKSVWLFLATTIGVGWVVFGEFIKKKLGI